MLSAMRHKATLPSRGDPLAWTRHRGSQLRRSLVNRGAPAGVRWRGTVRFYGLRRPVRWHATVLNAELAGTHIGDKG